MARLHLTGGIHMHGPDGYFEDGDLPGNQGHIALTVLTVERRPVSHDRLADIIWDGAPPARWKPALAVVTSKIRTLMSRVGFDGSEVVTSLTGSYAVSHPPGTWIDLEDALRRLDRAEGALRHGDAVSAAREATVASSVLRRPLLAGVACDWIEQARQRQQDDLYRCSITLASTWNCLGDHELVATIAEPTVRLDPLREVGHRLLIQAEHARGDCAAALRAYARCEAVLSASLGIGPSAETVGLADRIRRSTATGGPSPGTPGIAPSRGAPDPHDCQYLTRTGNGLSSNSQSPTCR